MSPLSPVSHDAGRDVFIKVAKFYIILLLNAFYKKMFP